MGKSKSPKIDLTDYRYISASPSLQLFSYALIAPIIKAGKKRGWNPAISLTDLTTLIGVDLSNEQNAEAVQTHQNRMRSYLWINALVSMSMYISVVFILLGSIVVSLATNPGFMLLYIAGRWYAPWVTGMVLIIIYFIILRLVGRVSSTILDRYYADSLAYVACLNLFVQLTKENTLILTKERQRLLHRIRGLRRYLILLSYQYPTNELGIENWARSQFRKMEAFTREKESQIIAPQVDTQSKMSGELYGLLNILLTAQYGEFKYDGISEAEELVQTQETRKRSWLIRLLGLVSPIILLAANYYFKAQLQALGFDNQIVALIGLAWLLLALDANLNLGFVDRITSLAKAMRELR